MRLLRRVAAVALVALCVGVVVVYQSNRPAAATPTRSSSCRSAGFYKNFSPSVRATIADVYWLYAIQYYGEHLKSDHRLDSLPAMVQLVTTLSPHFRQAYFSGAFAMLDAGRPDVAYSMLERGFAANPRDWHFPSYLGFFAYACAQGAQPTWSPRSGMRRRPGCRAPHRSCRALRPSSPPRATRRRRRSTSGPRSSARATSTPSKRPYRPRQAPAQRQGRSRKGRRRARKHCAARAVRAVRRRRSSRGTSDGLQPRPAGRPSLLYGYVIVVSGRVRPAHRQLPERLRLPAAARHQHRLRALVLPGLYRADPCRRQRAAAVLGGPARALPLLRHVDQLALPGGRSAHRRAVRRGRGGHRTGRSAAAATAVRGRAGAGERHRHRRAHHPRRRHLARRPDRPGGA